MAIGFSIGLKITMMVGKDVGMFAQYRGEGFIENLSIIAQVWAQYQQQLIFPNNLSIYYLEPSALPLSSWKVMMGLPFILATILGPIFLWRRAPSAAIGLVWIGLGLLPVSQIFPIQNLIADRYLLLPSAGFLLTGAALWPKRQNVFIKIVQVRVQNVAVIMKTQIVVRVEKNKLWNVQYVKKTISRSLL